MIGYDVVGTVPDADRRRAVMALRASLEPVEFGDLEGALGKLRVLTRSRAETDGDLTLIIQAYVDEMGGYPRDAVDGACREWAEAERFWPSWAELKAILDRRVRKRRAALAALEGRGP